MRFIFLPLVLVCFCNISFSQTARQRHQDSLAVSNTMTGFLDAFSNLKWEPFIGYFAEESTAFFPPSARTPARADNKKEIAAIFRKVFENAQKQTPAYISIVPKELKIQMLGDVAIVTFHLDDPGLFGRRTIVLKKINMKWLIVHLHASGVPKEG